MNHEVKLERLLVLVRGANEASCRFRVLQYAPHLRALGVVVEVVDIAVPWAARRKIFETAAAYDVVLVHRALLKWHDYFWFRRHVSHYVFDFDDAIMYRDSFGKGFGSWQRRLHFARMAGSARTVIAGNAYLGEWAARYNPRVVVIPTSIELQDYPFAGASINDDDNPDGPLIGWIGTRASLPYLQSIAPALVRVAGGPTRARLKIVADDFPDVPGLTIIKKRWALYDEVEDVSSFAVGVMPLADDPWTRGKCACKILQYFAASVPVVCSPVGANLDVVQHGRNGYFARTEDEWVARLEELLSDPDKRRRFGREGRALVAAKYGVQGNVGRLVAALTQSR